MTARLPMRLQKRGSVLLNQQCWLWGQDVRRAEGNLLLELGFERLRPPDGQQGCTQYTRQCAGGAELRLWGFGFYYRDGSSGLYLNRYAFAPQDATLHNPVWTASDIPREATVVNCDRVAAAMRVVAALEAETLRTAGLAYRTRCLFGWTKRTVPPADVVPAWLALAHDVEVYAMHTQQQTAPHTRHGLRCAQRPWRAA